ncbi:PP2C family serine/threonine-protein phosphatase [Alkalihalobacillus deserti]|uniref:PP2C family serine/threonine-protein phosphatase n=1 Tax=Alkalihalobacillus deserti TaxID=2879466 RepID=UPI001D14C565|nr:PP2C family serine/threonine-protein phosphatase [Alkalihalobacillus deserti]
MVTYYSDKELEVAAFERAKPGKSCSGDAHKVIQTEGYTICAIVDGLGSGESAFQSSKAAIDVIEAYQELSLNQIVEACNEALVNKRGAVLTVIKIDYHNRKISYCNHGNIGFVLYLSDGTTVQPVPARGYLSGRKQPIKTSSFPYLSDSAFVLYSDGLKKRPDKNLFLQMKSPKNEIKSLFSEEHYAIDDVTILVGKLF